MTRIIFVENVIPHNPADAQVLDQTAGYRSEMRTKPQHGSRRDRFIWTSIPVHEHEKPNPCFKDIPIKTSWSTQTNVRIPVLRAIFPSMIRRGVQDPQTTSSQDKRTISDCYILDQETNTPILPPIQLWAHRMGMDSDTLEAILSVKPCKQTTYTMTPSQRSPTERQCGHDVYCDQCEESLAHIGEAWNLKSSVDKLFDTILTFANMHDVESQETCRLLFSQTSFKYDHPVHICKPGCSLARNQF
jgi:hypothetical protein